MRDDIKLLYDLLQIADDVKLPGWTNALEREIEVAEALPLMAVTYYPLPSSEEQARLADAINRLGSDAVRLIEGVQLRGSPAFGTWLRNELLAAQDDCLLAIVDGRSPADARLRLLPPWRAVMIARVARRTGVGLEKGSVEDLIREATYITGKGRLAPTYEQWADTVAEWEKR